LPVQSRLLTPKAIRRKGQTAIMFTFAIVPLLGMVGLVVDIGWAHFRKQAAQTAADAAVGAAAAAAFTAGSGGVSCATSHVACYATEYECPASPSSTPANNIETGCLYAKENGFFTAGRQKVTFQSGVGSAPTASGVTVSYWMVARVTERIPQLFSAVLGYPEAIVTARATAATLDSNAGGCVIATNPTAANALLLSGTPSLTTGCGVFVNSNSSTAVNTNGTATITTTGSARTEIVGNCNGCANISPAPLTGVAVSADPFAAMTPPSVGSCTNTGLSLGSHDTMTIDPGVFCGGINLTSHAALTLNPGVYVIQNGLSLGAQTSITGTGVTIYLQTGGVNMAGGATVNLSAPTSGTWQGILFYQDRANTTDSTLVGGTTQLMNGVLYFPSAHLNYTGGSSVTGTSTTIVADTITLVGNTNITSAASNPYTGNAGGSYLIE
jgi:hypothetical protein